MAAKRRASADMAI